VLAEDQKAGMNREKKLPYLSDNYYYKIVGCKLLNGS
jgi:hypothetical protein